VTTVFLSCGSTGQRKYIDQVIFSRAHQTKVTGGMAIAEKASKLQRKESAGTFRARTAGIMSDDLK
jgi:hypothetical protein